MTPRSAGRPAFSFVELMTGVVILLLLTGITITWYQDSIQDAKLALARVETAGLADSISIQQARMRAPYVSSAPPKDWKGTGDDPWQQPYRIDPRQRLVSSSGPDRSFDTTGDDVFARWAEMPSTAAPMTAPVAPQPIEGFAPSSGPPTLSIVTEPGMSGRTRLRIEARSSGAELQELLVGERVFPLHGTLQSIATELKTKGQEKVTVTVTDRAGSRTTTDVGW